MKRISRDEALASIDPSDGCLMCHLVKSSTLLGTNPHAVAFLTQFPNRRGQVIVAARRHEERLERMPRASWLEMHDLAHRAAQQIDRVLSPLRVYICSLGSVEARKNSCPHVHLHVIPLFDGGDADKPSEVLTWTNGVFVYEDGEADELTRALTLRTNEKRRSLRTNPPKRIGAAGSAPTRGSTTRAGVPPLNPLE